MPSIDKELLRALGNKIRAADENEENILIQSSEGSISVLSNHIMFYSEITSKSIIHLNSILGKLMREQLGEAASRNHPIDPIYLHINSCGGSIFEGFLGFDIINAIKDKVPVITIAEGEVASAATLLLLAGTKKLSTPNSMILLHELSSVLGGTMTDLTIEYRNTLKIKSKIERIYAENTKIPADKIEEFLKKSELLDIDDALKYGLIDEVRTIVI